MTRQLIIVDRNGGPALWKCCAPCDECPFKFKCFTIGGILRIQRWEYSNACEPWTGGKNISLVQMGKSISLYDAIELMKDRHHKID